MTEAEREQKLQILNDTIEDCERTLRNAEVSADMAGTIMVAVAGAGKAMMDAMESGEFEFPGSGELKESGAYSSMLIQVIFTQLGAALWSKMI